MPEDRGTVVTAHSHLRRDALGLVHAVAIGVAGTAPSYSIATSTAVLVRRRGRARARQPALLRPDHQEETRLLKERLGDRPIHFTDVERRRLARKAKVLGRKVLCELETLGTPDTLMRWYRELVSSKWGYSQRRGPGRPGVMKDIVNLILRMALDNPSWGYTRIKGALANLGHQLGRGTIANILKDHGIEPAPERANTPLGRPS